MGGKSMTKVFIGVLIVTVVMIVIFQFVDPSAPATITQAIDTVTNVNSGDTISVSITGEVTRTGTYLLDNGALLSDLIKAASGVTSNADELAYDTSYVLSDGLAFYIAPKYNNTDVCSMEPITKVNINADSKEDLQIVNGLGSSTAAAIVSYREKNGPYKRIEDIKNVSGIGNATFEKVKNYIRLRAA